MAFRFHFSSLNSFVYLLFLSFDSDLQPGSKDFKLDLFFFDNLLNFPDVELIGAHEDINFMLIFPGLKVIFMSFN